MDWVADVDRFWFSELTPADWFAGGEGLDVRVRERLGPLLARVSADPPAPASLAAEGLSSAVILFDQAPRNIFRNMPRAYATDQLAVAFARHAVASGLDTRLDPSRRLFLYMPFMHAEDRALQAEALRLFTALGLEEQVRYATHHKGVVDRFGRFPHRNAILGRVSTPEEIAFLAEEAKASS
jgi:uncharacterized protein (DUF924 family)